MSRAEEMLANMSLDDVPSVYLSNEDEEEHIVINDSRTAIVPNSLKTIAVTGDKDIETVTFDCVRYWDGNDLSTFAIYLNYVLPDNTTGTYIPKAITTSDGDEFYHFDWEIKNNITKKSGKISFAITAVKTKQNENGEAVVDKQWSSLPNGDCSIALGLDISNVPSEEESNDVVAQLSAILEKIHGDVDEWIKTVVVQNKGTSTTEVMSQNAVTIEIEKLRGKIELVEENESSNYEIIKDVGHLVLRNSKRIENLESGIPAESFITDDSVAYVKDVPDNVAPNAVLTKIGGMTYKDGNALKHAKVTEIESVGVNVLPNGYRTSTPTSRGGVTFVENSDGYITLNGTATNSTYFSLNNASLIVGQTYTAKIFGATSGVSAYVENATGEYVYFDESQKSLEAKTDLASVVLLVDAGTVLNNVTIYPIINRGTIAMPHTPYHSETIPIPEAVQDLDGYGWGINESVYNYIDWEKKQFVKRVGCVDMGTLTWYYTNPFGTGVTCFRTPSIADAKLVGATDVPNLLCDLYPSITANKMSSGSEGITSLDVLNGIFVCDSNYTDAATFKSAMSGVILYYELAEPVITDISDLLPADNLISVEGGGTITFENEYKYAVPSDVTYQLR